MIRQAAYHARLALGFYRFIRTPPIADPLAAIGRNVENREANFLGTVRRAIFDNPDNPYVKMFRLAGCAFGDLEASVRRDGLEAALTSLYQNGVYLTHDEFKGRQPIVRSGQRIDASPESFVNPLAPGLIVATSGGSRSAGTRCPRSLEFQLYREAKEAVLEREWELDGRLRIGLFSMLPGTAGVSRTVTFARRGQTLDRWFTLAGGLRDSGHYRLATKVLVMETNLLGLKAPFPRALPTDDFGPVAEWIARRHREGRLCAVHAMVSKAVRVAAAAADRGLDISGARFVVAGEALTNAKRAVIEKTGSEVYPNYVISEFGYIGAACRHMRRDNCVHLLSDAVAVISRRRPAPLSDVEVNSLLFTSLLPFAPMVLINAEMDDQGILEPAQCDCSLSRMGFKWQIRDIWSYGKLTGQGTTLVGSDILRILEEVLPARFGGSPADYQLVEREGSAQTEIELRVRPSVSVPSTSEVGGVFLAEIRKLWGGALTSRMWRQTNGLKVVVGEPYTTRAGKVLALHLLGQETRRKT